MALLRFFSIANFDEFSQGCYLCNWPFGHVFSLTDRSEDLRIHDKKDRKPRQREKIQYVAANQPKKKPAWLFCNGRFINFSRYIQLSCWVRNDPLQSQIPSLPLVSNVLARHFSLYGLGKRLPFSIHLFKSFTLSLVTKNIEKRISPRNRLLRLNIFQPVFDPTNWRSSLGNKLAQTKSQFPLEQIGVPMFILISDTYLSNR